MKPGDVGPSTVGTMFATAAIVAYVAAPPEFRRKINAAAVRLLREVLAPSVRGDLSTKYPKAIDVR